jgi:hypothetical protein
MGHNDFSMNLNVSSNGTLKKEGEEAQKLADALKATEKAASGTSKALTSAKAASAPSARNKVPTVEENITYGIQKATVGTGAASRDFAKQSQGLGGLVRLYATFAANIFAVSAAFTALSNAVDTANLVKGLDQLGASSGRSLGTLSKKLADASEGAISLRDSMESVAKASSAGLSDKQILNLADSAKKAAQALGLSMPDALSRLTRGISKLEPELLDELGIFVRIDDATRKYALSVGKSAASLSDFERRQAFANAVLTQAQDKFGAIQIDVNPYSKLLASFQNISFAGLELVNKVLTPLVKLLAESPGALAALLGAIGIKLVSTALPAIGAWRIGLKAAAEQAAKTAEAISNSFGDSFQGRLEAHFQIPGIEKNLAAVRKQIDGITAAMPKVGAAPAKLGIKATSAKADEAGFNAVNAALKTRQGYLETGYKGQAKMSATEVAQAKEEVTWLKARQSEIIKEIELNKLLQKERDLNFARESAHDKALNVASKGQSRWDTEKIAFEQTAKARLNYDKILAVSNAAETSRILGLRLAWQGLNREIEEKGITGFNKFTTQVKGGIVATGTRLLGILGTLSNIIPVAATAFAAFEILSAVFSKNDREVQAFNSSVEDTHKAVETLDNTFDKISKKSPLEGINVASVVALSTALQGLSSSTEDLVRTLNKADKTASWFDRLVDGDILKIIGKDLRSKFTKEFALSISDSIEKMPIGPAKDAFIKQMEVLTGSADLSFKGLQDSIDSLDVNNLIATTTKMAEAQTAASNTLKASANNLQSFKDNLNSSVKAYQEMSVSLTANDPISKLGMSLMTSSTSLDTVLKDTTTAISGLVDILGDTTKLSLLPENSRNLLMAYSSAIEDTQGNVDKYTKAIEAAKKELKELEATQGTLSNSIGGRGSNIRDNSAGIAQQRKNIDEFNSALESAKAVQMGILNQIKQAGLDLFEKGKALLTRQIAAAKEQAGLTIFKAATQQATGFAKIGIDASIQKQEIDIQLKLISVQEELVLAQTKTNLLLTQSILENKKTKLEATARDEGPSGIAAAAELQKLTPQIDSLTRAIDFLSKGSSGLDLAKLDKEAFNQLGAIVAQLASSSAQRAKLGGDKKAVDITAGQRTGDEAFKNSQQTLQNQADLLQVSKERLANLVSIVGLENTALVAMKQQTEAEADLKTQEIARNALKRAEVLAENVLNETKKNTSAEGLKASADAKKELDAAVNRTTEFEKQIAAKNELRSLTSQIETIESKSIAAAKAVAFATELKALKSETAIAELDSAKEYLDYLVKIGAVDEATGIKRSANLEKELSLQKQAAEEASVRDAADAARASLATVRDNGLTAAGEDPEKIAAIGQQAFETSVRINAQEEERIKKIKLQAEAKRELLDITSKEAEQYAKIDKIGGTLAKVFEGLGESATKFGSGFGSAIKVFAQIGNRRVAIEKETSDKLSKINTKTAEGAELYNDIKQEGAKRSAEFEIDAAAETAGAVKNMFSEKTFAYKAFAAVEKAIHVAKLARMAVELTTTLANLGPTLAAKAAEASANGTSAITKALNLPPPMGFIAGAAMAAIVASLLGGKGKSVSIPAGVSAKDRQEVQGTGYSFNAKGEKVENGRGVFGDAGAKSESIAKSLEVIQKTSVEGITFSNKMVSLLTKINEGINGAAKSLYSIPGIRTGSQFGTAEGTNTSGGFLGIGGIFSKSTTKSIIDSGIKISGLFTDLLNNAKGIIQGYETVSTTVKKSGLFGIGGSTKTSISEQYTNLDSAVTKEISDVFQHATDLFVDAGGKLGMTAESIFSKLGSIKVDEIASLKGLQGADLEKELNSVLSNILDNASNVLFSSLDKYKKFGEGMLETVIRVIDSNEKIKQAFESIGQGFQEYADVSATIEKTGVFGLTSSTAFKQIVNLSFEVTEGLTKAAGGLSSLLDSISNYKDKFFTEAEQLVPIQAAVTKELASLGFASVKTKDDFKFLINGLDITSTAGQETYVKLLALADSFDRLAQAADATDNLRIDLMEAEGKTAEATALRRAKELKQMSATDAEIQRRIWMLQDEQKTSEETYSYEIKILQLLGKSTEALAKSRAKELSALLPQAAAQQKYIYALEDEIDIRDRANKAIESTVTSLKNSIATLRDYRTSLVGGDKSVLTPLQKYEEAKKNAIEAIQAATAPAKTVEEVLARETAVSKLPAVTTTWLEASRNLYASSALYEKDFNTVLQALDSTASAMDSQLSDAEKQLEVLKTSSNILETISDNTYSTTELMTKFLAAVDATKLAATNVTNVTSVTQTGNPSVVIPDVNTINQQLIQELIKANKDNLDAQLKAQEEQTAAIIRANALAEAANAAAIIQAQKDAIEQAQWNKNNAPVIDDRQAFWNSGGGG